MLYTNREPEQHGYELRKHTKLLLISLLIITMLAIPVASVKAKPPDPFATAVHTGGTGGGDGDVIFEIHNTNDAAGANALQVTETDNNQNQIRSVVNTPVNWINSGLLFKNGKAVQTTWQTCVPTTGCAPVGIGTSLGGFDVKMNGQAPYGWNWIITDGSGATFSGNLSVS